MALAELEFNIDKQKSLDLLIQTKIDYKKLEKKFEELAIKSIQKKLLNHKLYL